MSFVMLNKTDGDPVAINPKEIVALTPHAIQGTFILTTPGIAYVVTGTFEDNLKNIRAADGRKLGDLHDAGR